MIIPPLVVFFHIQQPPIERLNTYMAIERPHLYRKRGFVNIAFERSDLNRRAISFIANQITDINLNQL